MKTRFSKVTFCLLAVALSTACGEDNDRFEDVPHLEWRGSEFVTVGDPQDNRRNVVLQAYFNDRDGDIGSTATSSPDSCDFSAYNLFIRYFEKKGGSYQEILPADSCQPFHIILPNLTPTGQNKVLEGVIHATFNYFAYPTSSNVDSIKFELQLKDRAGHLSNLVTSPAIFVPQL